MSRRIHATDPQRSMGEPMRIGAVFSQADSGTDPDAIRRMGDRRRSRRLRTSHGLRPRPRRLTCSASAPGPFGSFPNAPYTVGAHLPRDLRAVQPPRRASPPASASSPACSCCHNARPRSSPSRSHRSICSAADAFGSRSVSVGMPRSTRPWASTSPIARRCSKSRSMSCACCGSQPFVDFDGPLPPASRCRASTRCRRTPSRS